jgi:hypothetical protein
MNSRGLPWVKDQANLPNHRQQIFSVIWAGVLGSGFMPVFLSAERFRPADTAAILLQSDDIGDFAIPGLPQGTILIKSRTVRTDS